jgi:sarcosine oxidase subunit alpha
MPDEIELMINGTRVQVPIGVTVAVAMMQISAPCRKSVTRESRAPLCGMGICFECRVQIDGRLHERSCQVLCASGMDVRTDE